MKVISKTGKEYHRYPEYHRNWCSQNPEKVKKIKAKWREKNRKRINEKSRANYRKDLKTNRIKARKAVKKAYRKKRKILLSIKSKSKCYVCGSTHSMRLHEKYGKKHPCSKKYYLEHLDDFIPLCFECHTALHRLAKRKVDITKFLELLKILNLRT